MYPPRACRAVNSGVVRQSGSAVLLAAVSIIVLGTGLVMAQLAATKADTSATTANQTTVAGTEAAAALAAAAGVSFVNNLTVGTNGLCLGSTGCSSGVYNSTALTGGAGAQAASWWTTSNAHSAPYAGLNTTPLYAIELVSCDATGLAIYKITGRAVENASTKLAGSGVSLHYETVSKTWEAQQCQRL